MIRDKQHAVLLAMDMATRAIASKNTDGLLSALFPNEHVTTEHFDLVVTSKFSAEHLFSHCEGQGTWGEPPATIDHTRFGRQSEDFQLALTLFVSNAHVLAALIPAVVMAPQAAAQSSDGRGFEHSTDDDDNRGTIYDKEDFGHATGAGTEKAEGSGQGNPTATGAADPGQTVERPQVSGQKYTGAVPADSVQHSGANGNAGLSENAADAHVGAGSSQDRTSDAEPKPADDAAATTAEVPGEAGKRHEDQGADSSETRDGVSVSSAAEHSVADTAGEERQAVVPDPVIDTGDALDPHSGGDVIDEPEEDAGEDDDEDGLNDPPLPTSKPSKKKR
jgi:hypothetical protein